ncbi:SAM domain (Sterile alpha motif) [Yoonia tamlensis]|uniref:SAM domain (Sterile alpha motif) n=1 Tax=Yoonia tamlensis TaxID=390270 RepID=A0A1I6HEI7_9RHOB|nr:AAA family ATPase [Yoonia tamlensis]SFR52915.1 SAM domain (Sterile alpha motif) [Yoonia tamlensis]
MPNIEGWLAEIGLQKYAQVFAEAEIDVETLPELHEEDLKELGLPLGPRRKIWGAIARMRAGATGRHAHVFPDPANLPDDAHAERRHLTVMFVDLVGSTEMVMRMDAEDMRGVISKYQHAVAAVVDEYKGFVATLLGDGMLCYFGWPHANEDDTDRALRAGLAIIEATKKIATPDGTALASRVGIAAGVVVVGDLIGGGARQEAAVVGETPNLAARLQAVAEPNQLVVPGEMLAHLGSTFVLVPLGAHNLKGIGRPIEAFVVQGETTVKSRFEARRAGTLIPIVGRDAEIRRVLQRWGNAQAGDGQMILLSGEAGIGKSRTVQAVVDSIAPDSHIRLTYQCSPYHTESAFYPFAQHLSYSAQFSAQDTVDERLDKVESLFQGTPLTHAVLAHLLGIDGSARYGEIDETPTQQRAQMMQALVEILLRMARDKPVFMVFEDLHWIDPTSLELLDFILAALPGQNIMILATTRPPFDHAFGSARCVTHIPLGRLDEAKTRAIVAKLTQGKSLPEDILQIIARRTDGVPLFIEELTKTILESGALIEGAGSYTVNGSIRDFAIPATLQDSLMARLDRLAPIKEIAQIAACVGREFDHQLMAEICDIPEAALDDALARLISAELIYKRGIAPKIQYVFKHALVRDAAYESLLKKRRTVFHRRILAVLEARPDSAPELLATHAEAAQLTDRAIVLWEAAAKAAMARPAYKEGETHLRRAIALNAPTAATGDKAALGIAIALKVQLFVALSQGKGLWSDEAIGTLEDALAQADKHGDTPLRGDIIYGLLMSSYFRGRLERSVARADELKGLAEASGDIAQLLVAKRLAAIGRLKMGRFTEAQPYLDEAEALSEKVASQNLAARFGHDPIVGLQTYQSLGATFSGKTARAKSYQRRAENRARIIGHTNTTCAMLGLFVICAHVANDVAAEKQQLRILRPMIIEHKVESSHLWAEATYALLQMAEGDATALATYRKAEEAMLDAGIRLLVPGNRVVAARRALALGLTDDAKELVDAAEALMNDTGENSWRPDIHRLRAAFAIAENDRPRAQKHLLEAISIAREGGGTLWQIRATIDLAQLYQSTGRIKDALCQIEPVFTMVAPGNCPQELEAAKALKQALSAAVA